ncbi:hypothetical protein KFE98_09060 [bacterium SCSIO 12741]|nr:hypothetical protein KFE98_09060 [bacterium SCSIO 12741]
MENSGSENMQPPSGSSNTTQKILIGLIVLSLFGNLYLGFALMEAKDQNTALSGQNTELNTEKNQVEEELYGMLAQYDSLTVDNDSIKAELDMEKAKVEELIQKVKNGNWTIYKLKKETESLRKVMKGFVHTIDSLNTANQELIAENQQIKTDLGEERQRSKDLSEEKKRLESKVKIGEQLNTVFMESYAQRVKSNTIHKRTDKASKTDKIKTCFTLNENELTKPGKMMVYVRIVSPGGQVLTLSDDRDNMFEFEGVRGLYSVKKEVLYENKEVDVCLYWEVDVEKELKPGKYIVHAYAKDYEIGVTEFTLR